MISASINRFHDYVISQQSISRYQIVARIDILIEIRPKVHACKSF